MRIFGRKKKLAQEIKEQHDRNADMQSNNIIDLCENAHTIFCTFFADEVEGVNLYKEFNGHKTNSALVGVLEGNVKITYKSHIHPEINYPAKWFVWKVNSNKIHFYNRTFDKETLRKDTEHNVYSISCDAFDFLSLKYKTERIREKELKMEEERKKNDIAIPMKKANDKVDTMLSFIYGETLFD